MHHRGKYGRCLRAAPQLGSISRLSIPAVGNSFFEIVTMTGKGEGDGEVRHRDGPRYVGEFRRASRKR